MTLQEAERSNEGKPGEAAGTGEEVSFRFLASSALGGKFQPQRPSPGAIITL